MSHFTTIQTQIRDVNALRAACSELGFELASNASARGYGRQSIKGDLVVRLPGPYDIAVNRQPDGVYGLTTDWWGGHVELSVGKSFGKLLQLYGVHKARIEAQRKGHTVQRCAMADGAIKLVIGLSACGAQAGLSAGYAQAGGVR